MQIRIGTLNDLDDICRVEKLSFKDPWTRGMFSAELENPLIKCFVAEDEGRVCAFVIAAYLEGIEAEIHDIAVEPECRRRGIAGMLMQQAIKEAERLKIADFTLEVRVSNKSAIQLYKSFDFASEGLRKGYYEDGEDADIMWRRK